MPSTREAVDGTTTFNSVEPAGSGPRELPATMPWRNPSDVAYSDELARLFDNPDCLPEESSIPPGLRDEIDILNLRQARKCGRGMGGAVYCVDSGAGGLVAVKHIIAAGPDDATVECTVKVRLIQTARKEARVEFSFRWLARKPSSGAKQLSTATSSHSSASFVRAESSTSSHRMLGAARCVSLSLTTPNQTLCECALCVPSIHSKCRTDLVLTAH